MSELAAVGKDMACKPRKSIITDINRKIETDIRHKKGLPCAESIARSGDKNCVCKPFVCFKISYLEISYLKITFTNFFLPRFTTTPLPLKKSAL